MSNQQEKALPKAPPKKVITTAPIVKDGIELSSTGKNAENKTEDYFELVLVDMIESMRSDKLITVKQNMYDTEYACVSYRWGELTEQITMTPDYNAHVTSFDLDDLITLCQQILNWSSDGGNLEYDDEEEEEEEDATVDGENQQDDDEDDAAIANDEQDDGDTAAEEEEEEEDDLYDDRNYSEYSIRYLWVDAISVNQRDAVHKKETIHRMTDIYHNAELIVAVPDLHRGYLVQDPARAKCLTNVSKYGRKIMRHVAQRCWRTEEEEEQDEQDAEEDEEEQDNQDDDQQQEDDEGTVIADDNDSSKTRKHRGFRQFIKETIYAKPADGDADTVVDGLTVADAVGTEASVVEQQDTPPREEEEAVDQDEEAEEEEEDEEEYECRCAEDLEDSEVEAYWDAVDYVDYLVDDWSARVWVVSEYNIGRHGKMKLWFISLCYDNYANRPRELLSMFDEREPSIYDNLLQERSFLHVMLNSRATREEDRFYAVLPLYPRYKELVPKISSWGIVSELDTRLQLYRMVSFEDKLTMLLCGARPSFKNDVILPSFASWYQKTEFDWALELTTTAPLLIKALELRQAGALHYLEATVPWSRTFIDQTVERDLYVAGHALAHLGLSERLDELVTVFLPVAGQTEGTQHTLGIKLFGHREQNKWIMLHRMMDLVDVPPTTPTAAPEPKSLVSHVRHPPHRSASLDTLWSDKIEVDQVFHIY